MYDIMYLDQTAREHGLYIKKRPDIPVPEREYSEYQIPGRDGKLYEDLKTVGDIEINIDFNFMSAEKIGRVFFGQQNSGFWEQKES